MIFAHWKNLTPPTGVITGPGSEHRRQLGRDEAPIRFILDIPEGTARDDVVAKLIARLFACGKRIEETDGLGFQGEWPQEVQRQFASNRGERWSWLSLQ